jgi:hypothetical protein
MRHCLRAERFSLEALSTLYRNANESERQQTQTGTGPMIQPFHLLYQGSNRSNDVAGITCLRP